MPRQETTWQEYDAIQAVIDGLDQTARECERKWGVGRLELLVSDDLREKFRRQLRRMNEAITAHDIERVRQAGAAMRRGWEALDRAATNNGAVQLDPEVWEILLSDGRVVALCRAREDAFAVTREGRYIDVWTMEEIARVIENFPQVALAKQTFPGAFVESIRAKRISEPFNDIPFVDPDEPAQEDGDA